MSRATRISWIATILTAAVFGLLVTAPICQAAARMKECSRSSLPRITKCDKDVTSAQVKPADDGLHLVAAAPPVTPVLLVPQVQVRPRVFSDAGPPIPPLLRSTTLLI